MPKNRRALKRDAENDVRTRNAGREMALRAPGVFSPWKVEITADTNGRWSSNSVRFAARDEAETYGRDLVVRLVVVRRWRVSESADPVNYRLAYDGGLVPIE